MKAALLFAGIVAFRGGTLIDGTGSRPVRNSLVVVSKGRFLSVGEATPDALRALPPGTEVTDASGRWIIPGLIDAHVHAESPEDLAALLRWGVTSARLMAEDVSEAMRLAAASGERQDIPQLFPAAPIFTARGGWWDQGQPPDRGLDRFPKSAKEARASVLAAARLGSAEVKLMLDDMGWCRDPKPRLPRMPRAVAASLLKSARDAGLRSIVHAPGASDAKTAIALGARALAHGVLEPLDPETMSRMAAAPVFYIPTMGVFEFLADTRRFVGGVLADPRAAAGLPPETVRRYRSPAYAEGYRERYPNFRRVEAALPVLRRNLVSLLAAGVPVALGTDMWAFPGLGVSVEMDLYVRAGLPPVEVLRAATQTAARSLGLADRGAVEPGLRADFLILDADPLSDVTNVRAIRAVYKAGAEVAR